MSLIQRRSHAQPGDRRRQLACHSHINQELEAAVGRYEPVPLDANRAPADPYVAWLAQRETAQEREDPSRRRWVYRYRGTGATAPNPNV
jgi:hypothetical protein